METRANYTLVGAFVVSFVIALIAFILWIARVDFSSNVIEYEIYFSRSVTGLKEGGTVLYRGVPVGTVKRVTLDPADVEKVRVIILVEKRLPIREDAFASLELQGITGVAYIQLNGGTKSAKPLFPSDGKERAVIPTRSSIFEEVTASLPAVLHQISKTFEEMRPLFSEANQKAFGESLQNIHAITKAIAPEPGKDNDIRELLMGMKSGVKEMRLLIGEMKSFLAENRAGIHSFTETGLPALTQFLNEGKEALGTISRIGQRLERSPSGFFYNDPKQGVRVP
jgi:phospholipid/cholesterol/gamma-HCH transport system substrate-binding protein